MNDDAAWDGVGAVRKHPTKEINWKFGGQFFQFWLKFWSRSKTSNQKIQVGGRKYMFHSDWEWLDQVAKTEPKNKKWDKWGQNMFN